MNCEATFAPTLRVGPLSVGRASTERGLFKLGPVGSCQRSHLCSHTGSTVYLLGLRPQSQDWLYSGTSFVISWRGIDMRLIWGVDAPASVDRYLLPDEHQLICVREHPAVLLGPFALATAGLVAAVLLTIVAPSQHQRALGHLACLGCSFAPRWLDDGRLVR